MGGEGEISLFIISSDIELLYPLRGFLRVDRKSSLAMTSNLLLGDICVFIYYWQRNWACKNMNIIYDI